MNAQAHDGNTTAPPRRPRRRQVSAAGLLLLLLLLLFAGTLLPRMLLADDTSGWTAAEQRTANAARSRLQMTLAPLQRLATTHISVADMHHAPTNCPADETLPVCGIVRIQTYTLFGVPFEQWTMTRTGDRSSWDAPS